MDWDQIKEIESSGFGVIGHHSHSHDYLIDKSEEVFLNDIKTSNLIFKEKSVFKYLGNVIIHECS